MEITVETSLRDLRGSRQLSERTYNILTRARMNTIGDVIAQNEWDIIKLRNLGKASLEEIKNILHTSGLKLGTKDTMAPKVSISSMVANLESENKTIATRLEEKESLIKKYEGLILEHTELKKQEQELDSKIASLLTQLSETQMKGNETNGPRK